MICVYNDRCNPFIIAQETFKNGFLINSTIDMLKDQCLQLNNTKNLILEFLAGKVF